MHHNRLIDIKGLHPWCLFLNLIHTLCLHTARALPADEIDICEGPIMAVAITRKEVDLISMSRLGITCVERQKDSFVVEATSDKSPHKMSGNRRT